MWANSVWGFFGLAVTFMLAPFGLSPDYAWLAPWFRGAAAICGVASVAIFVWPVVSKRIMVNGPLLFMALGIVLFLCGLAWQTWPKTGPIHSPEIPMLEDSLASSVEFLDQGSIQEVNTLHIDINIINKTKNDYQIRNLYLRQSLFSVPGYRGGDTIEFMEKCINTSLLYPETFPPEYRKLFTNYKDGSKSRVSAADVIKINDIKLDRASFAVPAGKTVSAYAEFPNHSVDDIFNISVYCPIVQFLSSGGIRYTAQCFGTLVSIALFDGKPVGVLNGAQPKLAILHPKESALRCSILEE